MGINTNDPLFLTCATQNYEWGIKGSKSLVAQLHRKNSGIEVDENKPYAEV